MKIKFVVYGEPCGQGRPIFSMRSGHPKAIDPAKSRNYKSYVRLVAQEEMLKQAWKPTELPIRATIIAYMGIPSSKAKKFKQGALGGEIRPTKKPDIDNICKAVLDGASILFNDDKQIVSLVCYKYYSDEPRVVVEFEVVS